jgi:anti-anti-sigma factor
MPTEFLKVSNLQSVTVVELALPDDLDSSEIDRLNASLPEIFADQPNSRWVLDLTNVQYMASAVLGLMVNIRHRVKSMNGKLALCQMTPRLHEIFRACCLEKLFTITRTRDDAIKAVR